jgi:hypothetical protein
MLSISHAGFPSAAARARSQSHTHRALVIAGIVILSFDRPQVAREQRVRPSGSVAGAAPLANRVLNHAISQPLAELVARKLACRRAHVRFGPVSSRGHALLSWDPIQLHTCTSRACLSLGLHCVAVSTVRIRIHVRFVVRFVRIQSEWRKGRAVR